MLPSFDNHCHHVSLECAHVLFRKAKCGPVHGAHRSDPVSVRAVTLALKNAAEVLEYLICRQSVTSVGDPCLFDFVFPRSSPQRNTAVSP